MSSFRILLLLLAITLGSCSNDEIQDEVSSIYVTVGKPQQKQLYYHLKGVGTIKAQEEATLFSKVSGKLIRYTIKEGGEIKKGEPVAFIDRDQIGYAYQEFPVLSTIDGIVGRTYLDQGQKVVPETPIALIDKLDKVRITVDLSERYLPLVHEGLETVVSVEAYPQEDFVGIVDKVSPVVDVSTRTFPLEAKVSNPMGKLKPGMYAATRVIIEKIEDAVVLPEEAIVSEREGWFVYVVDDSSVVHKREVSLGLREPGEVQIVEGLQAQDRVVITGHHRLQEGLKVHIKGD
ncbi:MAG: efflux RND transporter periplasmic adaptor subunit [Chlamydiota bacterium]